MRVFQQLGRAGFGGAVLLALAGCVSQQAITQNTEQMLAAAGFLEKPANTAQREARLRALPPYRVLSQRVTANGQDSVGYVYADPDFCHCVFVGDPAAYTRFQQYAFQQRLQQEQIAAMEMEENDSFGWGDWGPYPFWGYGGGVVIVNHGWYHGGGFHGGFHGGGFHGGVAGHR